ncbi:MAG: TetR/AcrR family transcriptional regulator [Cytophagales bacterium]|nr:TetR/AcrR family transcriptional regulator [Cytophagales bacterium]
MEKLTSNSENILETARLLFYHKGYSRVTMDEIAQKLGMSKKTLYKYYSGKNEILENVLSTWKESLAFKISEIASDPKLQFVIKLKKLLTITATSINDVTPVFLQDLQENSPQSWKSITSYKKEAAKRFKKLLIEGLEKKQVSTRLNLDLVVALYHSAINNLLDPVFWNQLPTDVREGIPNKPADIFDQTITIIYEGILNDAPKENYKQLSGNQQP